MRRARKVGAVQGMLLAAIGIACSRPAPVSPADRPPPSPPSASPLPGDDRAAIAAARGLPLVAPAEAPVRRVWTTKAEQDTCEEFPVSEAPPYSQFATQSECNVWVAERVCRPGFSCYDGCNTVACDPTGRRLLTTLLDCSVAVLMTIEFNFASPVPKGSPAPQLAEVQAALTQVFEEPSRKVIVIGHAGDAEAKTSEARLRLAARRAEVVRHLLLDAGLPRERLIARAVGPLETGNVRPGSQSIVSFRLDPDDPTRADATPEAQQRHRWCK